MTSSVQFDPKMLVPAFESTHLFFGRSFCGCLYFVREGIGRSVPFGVYADAGREAAGASATGRVGQVDPTGAYEVSALFSGTLSQNVCYGICSIICCE